MSKRKPKAAKARGWCIKDRDGKLWTNSVQAKRKDMLDNFVLELKDTVVRVLVTELPKKRSKR